MLLRKLIPGLFIAFAPGGYSAGDANREDCLLEDIIAYPGETITYHSPNFNLSCETANIYNLTNDQAYDVDISGDNSSCSGQPEETITFPFNVSGVVKVTWICAGRQSNPCRLFTIDDAARGAGTVKQVPTVLISQTCLSGAINTIGASGGYSVTAATTPGSTVPASSPSNLQPSVGTGFTTMISSTVQQAMPTADPMSAPADTNIVPPLSPLTAPSTVRQAIPTADPMSAPADTNIVPPLSPLTAPSTVQQAIPTADPMSAPADTNTVPELSPSATPMAASGSPTDAAAGPPTPACTCTCVATSA